MCSSGAVVRTGRGAGTGGGCAGASRRAARTCTAGHLPDQARSGRVRAPRRGGQDRGHVPGSAARAPPLQAVRRVVANESAVAALDPGHLPPPPAPPHQPHLRIHPAGRGPPRADPDLGQAPVRPGLGPAHRTHQLRHLRLHPACSRPGRTHHPQPYASPWPKSNPPRSRSSPPPRCAHSPRR